MASEIKEEQKPEVEEKTTAETVQEDKKETEEASIVNSEDRDNKDESNQKEETPKVKNEVKDSKEKKEVNESNKKTKLKEESEDEGDDEEEEKVGLLDRPVEVTGCRARKKVERLEIGFTVTKDKETNVTEGKGKKLGECPRIEAQIQKTTTQDLKPLHRILFHRIGTNNEIKKNLRKFSGFPFEKDSVDFNRRKTTAEKLGMKILKQVCVTLDLERSGTKEEIVNRIMTFLLNPEDSGKQVPQKKKASKDKSSKKKSVGKKGKTPKKNESGKESAVDDDESGGDNSMGGSDEEMEVSDEGGASSENEPKEKQKAGKAKAKVVKPKKDGKNAKGQKRKLDVSDDDAEKDKPAKKAAKMPTDEEISKLVKDILEKADLQEITMKKVIKQVSDTYPDFDLSHKKAFIKSTIKSVIT